MKSTHTYPCRRWPLMPALLLAMLVSACESVLEFDDSDLQPFVVVNALPSTDSLFFANVTYSRLFIDNQPFQPVSDAIVTLDVNGTTLHSTGTDGANHLFNYRPAAGDSLTLHVVVPGYEPITGSTRQVALPDMQPPVAEIDTLQPITLGNITFTLTDPAGTDNFYHIYILEHDSGSRWNAWTEAWDTIDTVIHCYFQCLNAEVTVPEVNATQGMLYYFNQLLITDSLINGQSPELTLSVMMLRDTAEHPLQRQYTLVVESLSPEAYRYRTELIQAQGAGQYLSEPMRLYSNLSSGAGIFAAIARRQYPLTFTYVNGERRRGAPRLR